MQRLFHLPEVKPAPSKYPGKIEKYEVLLDRSKCIACGACTEICEYIASAHSTMKRLRSLMATFV